MGITVDSCSPIGFLFVGNEMEFHSVDAAIAENLKTLGNGFSPSLNPDMEQIFLDLGFCKMKSNL